LVQGQESNPRQLLERVEALEARAHELASEGEPERARRVLREAQTLREEAEVRSSRRDRPDRGRPPERELMERRRQELLAALERVGARDGSEEEVSSLRRELMELNRALEEMEVNRDRPRRERSDPFGPEPDERERRLHHLRIAIENLHAAQMPDVAHALERRLEAIEHGRARLEAGPGRPRGSGFMRGEDGARPNELQGQLNELREQMEEMRHRMERLQNAVGELHRNR